MAHDPVADPAGRDLVDEAGRRWTTHWARWCSAKQVRQFLRRQRDVLVRAPDGEDVTRLNAEQAQRWWREMQRCFEVPGELAPTSTVDGLTCAAHVWRCDDGSEPARLLVFETYC